MTLSREDHQSNSWAEQFDKLCREQNPLPDVFAYLASLPKSDARTTADVLLVDQKARIERGQLRPVEEYFTRCPEVADSEMLSLELAAGEFQHRTGRGEAIAVETYLGRFPRLKAHLEQMLSGSQGDGSQTVNLPAVESTLDVPADALLNSTGDSTLEISRDSILNPKPSPPKTGEDPVDIPEDSSRPHTGDTTLEISVDSILNPKPEGLSTLEVPLDFSSGSGSHAASPDDTDSSEGTLQIDPKQLSQMIEESAQNAGMDSSCDTMDLNPHKLSQMMDEFDKAQATGTGQTEVLGPPGSPNEDNEGNVQATMFAEGVAYDQSRKLRRFGEYELIGEIARGGMGVVFKARQAKLKRVVALKMILAGQLADKEDIRRFYVEAEAAAALDHPNIVPIYEVGEYRGQHFFSMGYVEGESLAEKVADRPLPVREAAEMLKTIAEAVEYAHQQGVIHRDLKPANVLLDLHNQPKITDFGLAKRTDAEAELTTTGQIMGTPSYMPPEQASGDSSQVGPHSDVYALGAVLYCLLTGRPPFQAPTILELLQQVKDQEPVSPKRLTPNIPVDLETICLKCLAKEPHRRYESAQALADDLDRFLKGVPVLAHPVGTTERVWRWCKRYPVVAGLMAAVVCSLLLGAGVSASYAIIANRKAKEAMEQYERAEKNYHRAESNFERAERNFQKAQAAVDQFFVQVSENTLLNQPGMQPLQHELMQRALEYYQEFLKERKDDPDLQDELAITHFRVGLITEAVESPEAAVAHLEQARGIQEAMVKKTPQDPEQLRNLGNTLTALGRVVYRAKGYKESESIYQAAVKVREKLLALDLHNHEAQRELASGYMNLGLVERARNQTATDPAQKHAALELAIEYITKAQELRHDVMQHADLSPETLRKVHRDLGQGAYNLGNLQKQRQPPESPVAQYTEAAAEFEQALKLDPDDQRNRLRLAICYRLLASGQKEPQKAWQLCKQAQTHLKPLMLANPRIDDYRKELVTLHLKMAGIARYLKRDEEAQTSLTEAQSLIEPMTKNKTHPRLRADLAIGMLKLGEYLLKQQQVEPGVKFSEAAVAIFGKLVLENPFELDHHHNHHFALGQLGQMWMIHQQPQFARETYQTLSASLSQLADKIKADPNLAFERAQLQFKLAQTLNALAQISISQHEWRLAEKELSQAQSVLKTLIQQFPDGKGEFQPVLDQTESLLKRVHQESPARAEKPGK